MVSYDLGTKLCPPKHQATVGIPTQREAVMFRITIHFHMGDTAHLVHDNPEAVIAALRMSNVSSIEIYSQAGD